MSTHLPTKQEMNPADSAKKKADMEKLQDEYDRKLGLKPNQYTTPWHGEENVSPSAKKLLDALDSKTSNGSKLTKLSPDQEKKQKEFDDLVKHRPDTGTGTWKAEPVSKKERLLAWHKALGSPKAVVDAELRDLEKQEASR